MTEYSATIETTVVREDDEYFVCVTFDGTTRLKLGPVEHKFDAQDLAASTSKTIRATYEHLLAAQKFKIREQ
ncbi:hypothetical protein [Hyphomicrobium sp. ghe19]|uniref:hypothetical protein n=1 Tax=Hyphomicrobium sp. ghe19 TaxID=2682968 RepID=UPI0013672C40|nr:hypothetical protein HYPP_01966 [Hyphomicrobium sp. ghe19]